MASIAHLWLACAQTSMFGYAFHCHAFVESAARIPGGQADHQPLRSSEEAARHSMAATSFSTVQI